MQSLSIPHAAEWFRVTRAAVPEHSKFISEQAHDHPLTDADERAVSKVSVRFFLYYYSPFRASERLARMLAAQQSWIWVSFTNRCTKPTIWFFKFKSKTTMVCSCPYFEE